MADTILDLFERRVNESATRAALRRHDGEGWEVFSWKEWWEASERIAAGLIDIGVEAGDRVCILAQTRVEWAWIDMGVAMAGAISVPIFPSHLPDLCRHIIRDSEPAAVIAEDPLQLEKLLKIRDDISTVNRVIYLDTSALREEPGPDGRIEANLDDLPVGSGDEWLESFDELTSRGRRALATEHHLVADRRQELDTGQIATIVYTSGTLGKPKGVELTHRNFCAEVSSLTKLELLQSDDLQLLFLPLAHIFARILLLAAVGYGIETAVGRGTRELMEDLNDVQPTFFAGVPQIFERIRAKIEMETDRVGGLRRSIFDRALDVGRRVSRARREGRRPGLLLSGEYAVMEELVFDRLKDVFGGRIRFLICGGAPLSVDVAEFYDAAGLLILEGYGLTEATAVAAVNRPDDYKFGTVGRALPGVEITIDEDGEILLRGESLMRGYRGLSEATEEMFDEKGWLRTGDMGAFDREGFLRITGRKKELIVTSGGKNIAPAHIEMLLTESPLISHALAVGDARPYVSALISLEPEAASAWAAENGLGDLSFAALSQEQALRDMVRQHVDRVNDQLARFETVRKFAIVEEPFSQSGGELTPTSKVRRYETAEKYQSIIASFYEERY